MSEVILFTVEAGLARIVLNRPERLNAFNPELARSWRDVTVAATSDPDVKAILVAGSGPSFCAGGDVIEMVSGFDTGDITELAETINEGIRALTESSVPVVVAAQGTTAGGGLGILLASDYAVVASNSRLGSLYANVGLTPDLSVSAQLSRAVGERRALQLVLQDRLLTAEEARDWGLVAEIVEPDAVQSRAAHIARFWIDSAWAAYGQAKRLVRSQPTRSFADQLSEEARTIGEAMATTDAQARISAFAEHSRRRSDAR